MDTYHISFIDIVIYNKLGITGYIVHYKSGIIRRFATANKTIDEFIAFSKKANLVYTTDHINVWRYEKKQVE